MAFRIRLPQPAHGWKAFFTEIAVVVIGVLIALALEAGVEDLNWRQKAGDGRERLRLELAATAAFAAENIRTAPCVQAQLKQLEDNVLTSGLTLRPAPLIETRLGATTLWKPNRPWSTQTWDALRQDGTVNHLSASEQLLLGGLYTQTQVMADNDEISFGKAGVFRLMAYPIPLDAATRATLLQEIGAQSYRTQFDMVLAAQLIGKIRDAGLSPGNEEIDSRVERLRLARSTAQQYCIDHHLPLQDWRPIVEQYKVRG